MRCPACGHKTLPIAGGKRKCQNIPTCGGMFDPVEQSSGRIEGGTCYADPSKRLEIMEAGGPDGRFLRTPRPLRGGLGG